MLPAFPDMKQLLAGLSLAALVAAPMQATGGCTSDAMIVFDGSLSMSDRDVFGAPPRIIDARLAIRQAMPQVEQFRNLGLLIYGPGERDGCSNLDLRFAPRPQAAAEIVASVDSLKPGGMTPLTDGVRTAANVLDYKNRPATVVLVTDGNETCGGTPCAMSRALKAQARDLTIHVIGFRVRSDPFSWDNPEQVNYDGDTVAKCLADNTGGLYVGAETLGDLVSALTKTLGCALIGAATPLPHRQAG